jgi:hypothetical protein
MDSSIGRSDAIAAPFFVPDGLNAVFVLSIPSARQEYHTRHDSAWRMVSNTF